MGSRRSNPSVKPGQKNPIDSNTIRSSSLRDYTTRLPLDPLSVLASPTGRYNRSEGIAATATAVRTILSLSPRSLFIQAPQIEELRGYPLKESAELSAALQAPNIRFVSMIPAMWARMPDKSTLTRWYFSPDRHPTDAWAEVFADEVSKWMIANAPL